MLALKPLPGRVLVEIREKYSHVATTEQKYDTKNSGTVLAVWAKDMDVSNKINGYTDKVVFWDSYKNSEPIERDGKKYAFVKIEDLDGYEDEQSN